jgi:uncharacterized protein with LGFP repeats
VRAALGLATTAAAVALWAPTAVATPESDAADAITAAWEAAGGDDSDLGARNGEVYPVGEGFAEDFADGKMFYTPDTGARAMYGAVLEKYESLGGAADSDLGFPNADQAAGLASPDSRSITFSAADKPVIFYTPDNGAFVVRGAINAAWDRLGSSSGDLGFPVADETTDGSVITQKFSGGQLSWNKVTKAFSTVPPELAAGLQDLQVPMDATAAINRAWRGTGGADGPLGAKQGEQYSVGDDGTGQDFEGGKILFTPATGANAIGGDVLAKYESLGGPLGSDLGFPIASEIDGPIPDSRVSTFSGEDKPVIFFTGEHGAFVVRGAMKAAWDELGGAAGELGAPVGDQSVDGGVVSQKFSGGTISWDRGTNTFSTDPDKLASSLAGLQLPGQNAPSASASGHSTGGGFTWHWWWLAVIVGVLVLLAVLALAAWWWQRQRTADRSPKRRAGRRRATAGAAAADEPPPAAADADDEQQWPADDEEPGTRVRLSTFPGRYGEPSAESASEADLLDRPEPEETWMPGGEAAAGAGAFGGSAFGEVLPGHGDDADADADDPDAVDTTPTRVPTAAEMQSGRHAAFGAEPGGSGELNAAAHPSFCLPLDDPYQPPQGYPVKANTHSGLYYTPDSALYHDTLAEIWFASEEVAQFNGFVSAD